MATKKEKSDNPRVVRLIDLANDTGFSAGAIKKAVKSRGFEPYKLGNGPNAANFLNADDAEAFKQIIKDEKRHCIVPSKQVETGLSGVYAIEVPSYSGSVRVKIGWSDNIEERINTYKTIVPDLRVSRVWPCTGKWNEQMALEWARKNGKRIGEELFEFEDNGAALSELEELFAKFDISPRRGDK